VLAQMDQMGGCRPNRWWLAHSGKTLPQVFNGQATPGVPMVRIVYTARCGEFVEQFDTTTLRGAKMAAHRFFNVPAFKGRLLTLERDGERVATTFVGTRNGWIEAGEGCGSTSSAPL
jgi:hypothetical protein